MHLDGTNGMALVAGPFQAALGRASELVPMHTSTLQPDELPVSILCFSTGHTVEAVHSVTQGKQSHRDGKLGRWHGCSLPYHSGLQACIELS